MDASQILDRFYDKAAYPTTVKELDEDVKCFRDLGWNMTDEERQTVINYLGLEATT